MNWGFPTEFYSISCFRKTFNHKRLKGQFYTHTPLIIVLKYPHLNLKHYFSAKASFGLSRLKDYRIVL